MRRRYWLALAVASLAVGVVLWNLSTGYPIGSLGLLVAAAGIPLAILPAVSGRLDTQVPGGALVSGGTIGVVLALILHALVFGFAYLFFFGFADAAIEVLETLRVDPQFIDVAASPWALFLFFQLVLVAPISEEISKSIAAWVGRPNTRQQAFLVGVAAGVGFAIVENALYASGGFFFSSAWEAVATVRMIGSAVHPLATGLIVVGWWEWRQGRDVALLAKRFLSGVGIHALWNGSIVVLVTVGEAYGIERLIGLGSIGVAYAAGLGALAAAMLWRMTISIAEGQEKLVSFDGADTKTIAAWTVLSASLLVPVALLFISFPELAGG